MADQPSRDPDPPGPRQARPVSRTATEARQGEIILGRRGRWIWIGAFAVLILLLLFGLL